jgi:hypothetical protein
MKNRIEIVRCAVAVAVTLALLFALCWLGALLSIGPATHMFVLLFTAAAPISTLALLTGICSALFFGGLAGAIFALTFNFAGRFSAI